jgi:hypothetical protein
MLLGRKLRNARTRAATDYVAHHRVGDVDADIADVHFGLERHRSVGDTVLRVLLGTLF